LEVNLVLPPGATARIVLEPFAGKRTVFTLLREGGKVEAGFEAALREDEFWRLHPPAASSPPPGPLEVSLVYDGRTLRGRVADGQEIVLEADKVFGRANAGLEAGFQLSTDVEVSRIALQGTIVEHWFDDLETWVRRRALFVEGKAVPLVGEIPLSSWRVEGGDPVLEDGAISLAAQEDGSWMWVPGVRPMLGRDEPYVLTVEVQRRSDRGHFFLTLAVGERDVGWLVVPEREEGKPAGSPEEQDIVSAAPFADGAWHTIRIELGADHSTLYLDGNIREMFSTEDLLALERGALRPRGIGFGAFGGRWRVRALGLRRLE
jgi:hypothetical protein